MTLPDTELPPPVALDYGRPPERSACQWRDLVLGIVISAAGAIGAGCFTYGVLRINQVRDDEAAVTAVGLAFLTLAACLVILMFYLRLQRR